MPRPKAIKVTKVSQLKAMLSKPKHQATQYTDDEIIFDDVPDLSLEKVNTKEYTTNSIPIQDRSEVEQNTNNEMDMLKKAIEELKKDKEEREKNKQKKISEKTALAEQRAKAKAEEKAKKMEEKKRQRDVQRAEEENNNRKYLDEFIHKYKNDIERHYNVKYQDQVKQLRLRSIQF